MIRLRPGAFRYDTISYPEEEVIVPFRVNEYKEVHQTGRLEVTLSSLPQPPNSKCDVGVQIAADGRIWICVNGAAFLRFKPSLKETKE